ncbi:MAG: tetratricopeptide repeat protein [Myxococcales bacterium]|nr:tetratricopeptide repeat protein [Myxococcales bacterium]
MARSGPDDNQRAQELLEQGASLYEEGKLYEALSCWKQVLRLDPQNEIAAEYLRFIEDNFQIAIDAFIEHHDRPAPEAPLLMGPDDSLDLGEIIDESVEELDWTELLDDGPETSREMPPPPPPVGEKPDEAFFGALGPGSLDPEPGDEAEAWGARRSSGPAAADAEQSVEMMPDIDPMQMPRANFAVPFAPSGSGPTPVPLDQAVDVAAPSPAAPASTSSSDEDRRDLTDMSDDSIEMMLEEDFKAWEETHGGARPGESGEVEESLDLAAPISPRRTRRATPRLNQRGEPYEQRRPPSFGPTDESFRPDEQLRRSTGPLKAVEPRDEGDVEGPLDFALLEPPEPRAPVTPAPISTPPPPLAAAAPPAAAARVMVERRPRPDPVPETPRTDLDDELRALLQVGMAEIESIQTDGTLPPRRLIQAPSAQLDLDAVMREARKKQQAGDFTGSLALVEQVLAADPDHNEGRLYLEENTTRLLAMYRSRLGGLSRVPRVRLRQQEIVWQSLDHREGFLLSQVDGRTSFEEIVDISGMPELEATRILARLVEHGVIG